MRVRGEPRGSPWEDPLPQRRGSPVRGPRPPALRKETLKLAHCEQPRWAGPQPTHVSFPAPRAAPWSSRSQRHSRGKLRMKHSPFPRSAPTYPAHRHKRATKDTAGSCKSRRWPRALGSAGAHSRRPVSCSCWAAAGGLASVYRGPKEGKWGCGEGIPRHTHSLHKHSDLVTLLLRLFGRHIPQASDQHC